MPNYALKFWLSGGVANSDPDLSLGGDRSLITEVTDQTFTASIIPGTTVHNAAGNPDGVGSLDFNFTNNTLQWTPLNGLTDGPVNLSLFDDDVLFTLNPEQTEGQLVCSIVAASLPGSDDDQNITIATLLNNLFQDITAIEASIGHANYRGLYVENIGALPVKIAVYVRNPTTGSDVLSAGWDAAGTMVTIVDEHTAPLGIVFDAAYSPYDESVIANLDPAEYLGLWIRHAVQPYSPIANSGAAATLGFRVTNQ